MNPKGQSVLVGGQRGLEPQVAAGPTSLQLLDGVAHDGGVTEQVWPAEQGLAGGPSYQAVGKREQGSSGTWGAPEKELCGAGEGNSCGSQAQPSKAQTKVLLAPSSESPSPLGVLQEQICFGLLREGLGGTEVFQEHDTGLYLVKAVGWGHLRSLSCSESWAHTSRSLPSSGEGSSHLCLQPGEGGEGAVEDGRVQVVVDLQGLLV